MADNIPPTLFSLLQQHFWPDGYETRYWPLSFPILPATTFNSTWLELLNLHITLNPFWPHYITFRPVFVPMPTIYSLQQIAAVAMEGIETGSGSDPIATESSANLTQTTTPGTSSGKTMDEYFNELANVKSDLANFKTHVEEGHQTLIDGWMSAFGLTEEDLNDDVETQSADDTNANAGSSSEDGHTLPSSANQEPPSSRKRHRDTVELSKVKMMIRDYSGEPKKVLLKFGNY
ncbi:hypothetical protein FDECE_8545, partial [Fusarium decemcellulare]